MDEYAGVICPGKLNDYLFAGLNVHGSRRELLRHDLCGLLGYRVLVEQCAVRRADVLNYDVHVCDAVVEISHHVIEHVGLQKLIL